MASLPICCRLPCIASAALMRAPTSDVRLIAITSSHTRTCPLWRVRAATPPKCLWRTCWPAAAAAPRRRRHRRPPHAACEARGRCRRKKTLLAPVLRGPLETVRPPRLASARQARREPPPPPSSPPASRVRNNRFFRPWASRLSGSQLMRVLAAMPRIRTKSYVCRGRRTLVVPCGRCHA